MTSLRILLCGRVDLLTKPGGDTRQILGLRRWLGKQAELSLELEPNPHPFNVIHVFNLSRPIEPALQAERARAAGRPVICTAIYQDLREYNRRGRWGSGRALFHLLGDSDDRLEDARLLVNVLRSRRGMLRAPRLLADLARRTFAARIGLAREMQRRIVQQSQMIVCSSPAEAASVERDFPDLPAQGITVLPLGIDPKEHAHSDGEQFRRRWGFDRFVLCVSRIEDLKNQLSLIQSMDREPLPLVLIGAINALHRGYARVVARAAARRPETLILSTLSRPLCLSAMAAAAVHVLPSWYETTGLVSLEAAAAGCAVVSTDRGGARAYLRDEASYCDPGDQESIRTAVRQALAQGSSPHLRARVLSEFTEERYAKAMLRLYEQVAG